MNGCPRFIMTMDKDIADKLKQSGYVLFSEHNKMYFFENKPDNHFSETGIKGVVFTNKVFL